MFDQYAETGTSILRRVNHSDATGDVVEASHLLMGRLVNSGNTLRVLFEDGKGSPWVHDGVSILRTSYDAMLQSLYIFSDNCKSQPLARRFLDFRVIEQMRLIRLCDKQLTDLSSHIATSSERQTNGAAIQLEFERVCKKYGFDSQRLPHNWYPSDLRQIANKLGYESEYELLQKMLSSVVHSSVFGLDTSFLRPEIVLSFQWNFAFRVLDRLASFTGVILTPSEKELLHLSHENVLNRPS